MRAIPNETVSAVFYGKAEGKSPRFIFFDPEMPEKEYYVDPKDIKAYVLVPNETYELSMKNVNGQMLLISIDAPIITGTFVAQIKNSFTGTKGESLLNVELPEGGIPQMQYTVNVDKHFLNDIGTGNKILVCFDESGRIVSAGNLVTNSMLATVHYYTVIDGNVTYMTSENVSLDANQEMAINEPIFGHVVRNGKIVPFNNNTVMVITNVLFKNGQDVVQYIPPLQKSFLERIKTAVEERKALLAKKNIDKAVDNVSNETETKSIDTEDNDSEQNPKEKKEESKKTKNKKNK